MFLRIPLKASYSRVGQSCSRWPVRARFPLVRVRAVVDPDPQNEAKTKEPTNKELPDWVKWQIAEYDRSVADAKQAAQEQRKEVEKFTEQIEDLQLQGAPRWILANLSWLRDLLERLRTTLADKAAKMEEGRDEFVLELTELVAAEQSPTPTVSSRAIEGMTEEQRTRLEEPGTLAATFLVKFLATATLVNFLGSLAGAEWEHLLVWPQDWQAGISSWVMWTTPYVGGTLLAGLLLPTYRTRRVVRGANANARFFAKLDKGSLALLGLVSASMQVVVFQGTWLDLALKLYRSGGGQVAADPALVEESLKGSLGSLVATPGIALIAAPLAILSVALVEAGWWGVYSTAEAVTSTIVVEEGGTITSVHKQHLDDTPLQDQEIGLLCARIFASSAFLSSEALLTGSLWYAMGTSTLGLLTSLLLAQERGKAEVAS